MDGTGNYYPPSSSSAKKKKKMKPEESSKRRKVIQKSAMVKIESSSTYNVKQMKSECPPLDSWTWRKYGQKPIKGSPFPRGYYRCSTSKGCSAKKQVERCKTDSSIIIITYTSDHNHPSPHHSSLITNLNYYEELPITPRKEYQDAEQEYSTMVDHEHEEQEDEGQEGHIFHYLYSQSPLFDYSSFVIRDDEDPFGENFFDGETVDDYHISFDDDHHHHQLLLPTVTSDQENDGFFDELEEL